MPNLELSDFTPDAKGYMSLDCVVRDCYLRPNMDGTNWALNFMFEIAAGTHAGKHVFGDFWLSQKALDNTLKRLEDAFGWVGAYRDLRAAVDGQIWMGKGVRVSLKADEYNGKTSLKVSGMFPLTRRKASADDWDKFFSSIEGTPPPAAAPATDPGKYKDVLDDSLPF